MMVTDMATIYVINNPIMLVKFALVSNTEFDLLCIIAFDRLCVLDEYSFYCFFVIGSTSLKDSPHTLFLSLSLSLSRISDYFRIRDDDDDVHLLEMIL